MPSHDLYKTYLTQHGETYRERHLFHEKLHLKNEMIHNLACRDVLVNGEAQKLTIVDGTLPYYKDISSLPDESFEAGQYVQVADSMWLIVSRDWDNEVYTRGKMQQCNYELKWQNIKGEVITRWGCVLSASKYNTGEEKNNIIVTGSNALMMYLPLDDDVLEIETDKRVFLDFQLASPKCYKITRFDTVTMSYEGEPQPSYNGKGCVLLVLVECATNPDTDRPDLMLADYIEAETPVEPTVINLSYKGNAEVRIGGQKTFTTDIPVEFELVSAVEDISLSVVSNTKCIVKAKLDENLVGRTARLIARGSGATEEVSISCIGGV